ncbi:hypothetical protein VPH35_016301 [Triticum aestivum]|nr:eukaryotic translation initiation factor 2 subunit gamma-like isoform X1 [Triticum aestivum]
MFNAGLMTFGACSAAPPSLKYPRQARPVLARVRSLQRCFLLLRHVHWLIVRPALAANLENLGAYEHQDLHVSVRPRPVLDRGKGDTPWLASRRLLPPLDQEPKSTQHLLVGCSFSSAMVQVSRIVSFHHCSNPPQRPFLGVVARCLGPVPFLPLKGLSFLFLPTSWNLRKHQNGCVFDANAPASVNWLLLLVRLLDVLLYVSIMARRGLMEQDLTKLDVTKLHPLSPEVISRQATINIGTIGHVAHGKSTVVKAISGVQTVRFKNELERNITIKLGYANAKIYKCEDDRCPRPMCYKAYGSGKEDTPACDVPGFENTRMKLLRHVSFVDCPGHDILMATMLNGAAIMDGALLLIAANESCPQPQTSEHLAAVEIMRLQHLIILQNKIDLIQESAAMNQHEAIQKFIQGTIAEGAPVVPISAQLKYNIDVICEYIIKKIPIPERNFTSPPNMIVIRSFDVNKPGSEVDEIRGGVAGGSILRGVLRVNQNIEVRPGIVMKDESGNIKCTPIYSRIVSLYAEQNELQFAVPGGLIGVGTTMDPTLTRADRLVGQVLGEIGSLPDVFVELEINFFLLRRLLGVRTKGTEKAGKVSKLTKGEILMLNIGSMSTGARVVAVKNDLAKLQLTAPVCTSKGEKVALSRRVEKHWRLIGWGQIQAGATLEVPPCPL